MLYDTTVIVHNLHDLCIFLFQIWNHGFFFFGFFIGNHGNTVVKSCMHKGRVNLRRLESNCCHRLEVNFFIIYIFLDVFIFFIYNSSGKNYGICRLGGGDPGINPWRLQFIFRFKKKIISLLNYKIYCIVYVFFTANIVLYMLKINYKFDSISF